MLKVVGKFADLGAGFQLDPLGEISAGNGAAGFGKDFEGIGNAARRIKRDDHAGKDSE